MHHPSEEMIFDYATGALDEAWALAIATHLSLCPACRAAAREVEAIGGSLLEAAVPTEMADGSYEAVMARLDFVDAMPPAEVRSITEPKPSYVLPEPLRQYAGGDVSEIRWRALGGGAAQCILSPPSSKTVARLLRIPAGRPVPEHSHRGTELTLVLAGAFADSTGHYARGDLQEADADLLHQPRAAEGEDCICLAVTDAPLSFRALLPRLAQRYLRI